MYTRKFPSRNGQVVVFMEKRVRSWWSHFT